MLPWIAPEAELFGVDVQVLAIVGGLAGAVAILVWWLAFSRARGPSASPRWPR